MNCLLITSLLIIAIGYGDAINFCKKFLRELADSQSNFVHCSTVNSVPVTLCKSCDREFALIIDHYQTIIKNETCFKEYFDQDRVNIVSTTQKILTGLWSKANCDDCFNSNNSGMFDWKTKLYNQCLDKHQGIECESCLDDYMDLNRFYIKLDQHNNGKVCYDMQDSMNRTRAHWSKQLKCCPRKSELTAFIIAVSFVALLPIIFYGATYAVTKRQEQNHGILNEEEPELETPTTSTINDDATSDTTENKTSKRSNAAINKKADTDSSDSTDSSQHNKT